MQLYNTVGYCMQMLFMENINIDVLARLTQQVTLLIVTIRKWNKYDSFIIHASFRNAERNKTKHDNQTETKHVNMSQSVRRRRISVFLSIQFIGFIVLFIVSQEAFYVMPRYRNSFPTNETKSECLERENNLETAGPMCVIEESRQGARWLADPRR